MTRATLLWLGLLPSCQSQPSDLREWRPSDHQNTTSPAAAQGQVDPEAEPKAAPGMDDVTIVAWQQNCVQCHGTTGRGDGPRGPMVKATNLTDPAWQAGITDAGIARVIREGKGLMPATNLPEATVNNLVKLVRLLNASRPEPASSAAPASSASAPAPAGAGNRPAASGAASAGGTAEGASTSRASPAASAK